MLLSIMVVVDDGWMDKWMGGWMGGWIDGWMDGWMKLFFWRLRTLNCQKKMN